MPKSKNYSYNKLHLKEKKCNAIKSTKFNCDDYDIESENFSCEEYDTEPEKYNYIEPKVEILNISPDKSLMKEEIFLFLSTDEKYLSSYCDLNNANSNYSRWTVPQHFAVNTFKEFEDILRNYEHDTFSWFIKTTKYKTKTRKDNNQTVQDEFCSKSPFIGKNIRFKEQSGKPIFCGMAYEVVAVMHYACHFSKNRNIYISKESNFSKKMHQTKKINCPVTFEVKKLLVFPDYRIDLKCINDRSERLWITKAIREEKKEKVRMVEKIVFTLPSTMDHNHSLNLASTIKEPTDKRILQKVEDLVLLGITDTLSVTKGINQYIKHDLKIDDSQLKRGRYTPSNKSITNKIYSVCRKNGMHLNDTKNKPKIHEKIVKELNLVQGTDENTIKYGELADKIKFEFDEIAEEIEIGQQNNEIIASDVIGIDLIDENVEMQQIYDEDCDNIRESAYFHEEFNVHDSLTLSISSDNNAASHQELISNTIKGQHILPRDCHLQNKIHHQLRILNELSGEIDRSGQLKFLDDLNLINRKWENYLKIKLKLRNST